MEELKVLAIDPSGNFKEGKGNSGWVLGLIKKGEKWPSILEYGVIKAQDFDNKNLYFLAVLGLINKASVVVIENFITFGGRAKSGSDLETSKLIGALELRALEAKKSCFLQNPALAKSRWPNKLLMNHKKLFKKGNGFCLTPQDKVLSRHTLDALRHLYYFVMINKNSPKL